MPKSLCDFMRSLWDGTELVLGSNTSPTKLEIAKSLTYIQSIEPEYRTGLPFGVPAVNVLATEWALLTLYRVSQFLVFRELPEEMLRTDLAAPCPEEKSADVCYSVDLSFRFLPEMVRLTRAVNAQDPLLEFLNAWAVEWPLSSVGIPDVNSGPREPALDPILGNQALLTMYVDRIIVTGDASRLNHPVVAEAVRSALGGFRELSPVIYDLVF